MLVSDALLFSDERPAFAFFFQKFQRIFDSFLNFKNFLIFKICCCCFFLYFLPTFLILTTTLTTIRNFKNFLIFKISFFLEV